MSNERWVTIAEAARELGNSKYTIYAWLRKDLINQKYIGNLPNGQLVIRLDGLIQPKITRKVKKRKYTHHA